MKLSKTVRGALMVCLLALVSQGCEVIKPTPVISSRLEFTLGRVTADYIQAVYDGNMSRLETFINWPTMLKKGSYKRTDFERQLSGMKGRWTPEQHPLFNLEIADIDVDDNEAEVTLKRTKGEGYPRIEVSLRWVGSGWVIVEDSLFGPGKQIEKWERDPSAFKR